MELLIESFEYDRWANRQWFAHLEAQGWPEVDRELFRHILSAQEAWHMRLVGISPTAMPTPEISETTIDTLHEKWVEFLGAHPEDPVISYRRINGVLYEQPLSRIARHVVNHGTYHRGELRGLCRARGFEAFPESDLIGFYVESDRLASDGK